MMIQLHDDDQTSERDIDLTNDGSQSPMTPRMRRGIVWSAAGLLTLGVLVLFAAESLVAPGGWSLPAWLWPIPLVIGIALTGLGFGVMVDEGARINRADSEADGAFGQSDDESAFDNNSRDREPPEE